MTENDGVIPDSGAVTPGTTGRQLREAREAKGWDIQSLSESLHLRPSVLQAIEAGHYQGVPELFLKGYVRSYARLLGMDGDRLMPQLDAELQPLRQQEAEREVHTPIFHIEEKKRKKKRIAFWVLLLLLVCIVGFAVVRFQTAGTDALEFSSNDAETEAPITEAEEVFEGQGPRRIELVNEAETEEPETETVAIPGEANSPAENVAAPDAPESEKVVPEPRQPLAEISTDTRLDPAASSTSAPDAEAGEVSPDANAGEAEPQANQSQERTPEPPAQAEVSFEIEFDGDCWIEIRNGAGERVYAALRSAGDTLSRSAVPPVSFVIGNVGAIASFSFAGEPVNVDGYRAWNGRAEITLGSDSGN